MEPRTCVRSQEHMFGNASCPGSEQRQRYAQPMSTPSVEPRHLRSALEFAVVMAREGQKIKPPLKSPPSSRSTSSSAACRAARCRPCGAPSRATTRSAPRLAAGALPELVDPIGRAWLHTRRRVGGRGRPPRRRRRGRGGASRMRSSALQRAEKRLVAAEQAAARSRVETVSLQERMAERDAVIDGLRSDIVKHDRDDRRVARATDRHSARGTSCARPRGGRAGEAHGSDRRARRGARRPGRSGAHPRPCAGRPVDDRRRAIRTGAAGGLRRRPRRSTGGAGNAGGTGQAEGDQAQGDAAARAV